MDKIGKTLDLAGRALIAGLFIPAGVGKIAGFSGTAAYIASAGLPLPELGAAAAIAVEAGAGAALLLGFKTRWAAIALAIFTLAASLFFHPFWAVEASKAMVQQLMFFKNVAIVGGLLAIAARPSGAWSLDAKMEAAKQEAGSAGLAASRR